MMPLKSCRLGRHAPSHSQGMLGTCTAGRQSLEAPPTPRSFSSAVQTPLGMSWCLMQCTLSSRILLSELASLLAARLPSFLLSFLLFLTVRSCSCTARALDGSSTIAASLVLRAASALKLLCK